VRDKGTRRRRSRAVGNAKRVSRRSRGRLQVFVVMPNPHSEAPRVHALLRTIAGELRDPEVKLVFAHQALSTHALLIKNLRRVVTASDVVLCFTDGRNPDVSFEAGVGLGLGKPVVVVILPGTWVMPETFAGHYYLELVGDVSDQERLKSALTRVAAGLMPRGKTGAPAMNGRSIRLPRFMCAVAMKERAGKERSRKRS